MVDLFCESDFCTKVRNPNGDIRYKSKVFKQSVSPADFRPGKHHCADCNRLLILGKRRESVLRRGRNDSRSII